MASRNADSACPGCPEIPRFLAISASKNCMARRLGGRLSRWSSARLRRSKISGSGCPGSTTDSASWQKYPAISVAGHDRRRPSRQFAMTTSLSVSNPPRRARTNEISPPKNKSSFPENGLFGRRAPRATVLIKPTSAVNQCVIKLVSVSLVRRVRMPQVVITRTVSRVLGAMRTKNAADPDCHARDSAHRRQR